jgi:dephospho-CoA kinase
VDQVDRRWLLGGGIGSGKSAVRQALASHGVSTLDADSIGHAVLEPGGPAFEAVAQRWPSVVVDGQVDRPSLGRIVFGDAEQLRELEDITHPHIFGAIVAAVEDISGLVVVEIPLLRKAPPGTWRRIVVDCPDDVRLRRLVARGMPEGDARARMASQASRAEWLAVADLVVPNHGDLDDLGVTVGCMLPEI